MSSNVLQWVDMSPLKIQTVLSRRPTYWFNRGTLRFLHGPLDVQSPIAASKAATSWRVSLVLGFAGKFVAHTHIHMYMHVHSECRQKPKSISSINGSVLISLVDQFINVLLGWHKGRVSHIVYVSYCSLHACACALCIERWSIWCIEIEIWWNTDKGW